jgi:hypothetical protein
MFLDVQVFLLRVASVQFRHLRSPSSVSGPNV